MGWLGTRLRKKPSEEDLTGIEEELEPDPGPLGPPLVLLVPEIAGGSTYRVYGFYDVAAAAEVIENAMPAARAGIHAFWALDDKPADPGPQDRGEGMVLIRTGAGSDLVYVVSFVDIESAESFARFEVKRGLDVGLVMIYWAAMVEIDQTGLGWTFTPPDPPASGVAPQLPVGSSAPPRSVPAAEAPPSPRSVPSLNEAEAAGDRYRQDEASAAGMVEEETAPAASTFDIRSMRRDAPQAATNGASVPVEDAQPAEAPAEEASLEGPVAAFAGDEEIADRILHEALGDREINLTLEEESPPTVAEPPPAETVLEDSDPELDLFHSANGGPRPGRKGQKPRNPQVNGVDALIAPQTPPEPEASAPEPVALEQPEIEAVDDVPVAQAEQSPEIVTETTDCLVVADEQVADDVPAVDLVEVPEAEPAPQLLDSQAGAPQPVTEIVLPPVEAPAEPEPVAPEPVVAAPVVPALATLPEAEAEPDELTAQVEKILRIPRWEKREDPFKGFNSPPGRF